MHFRERLKRALAIVTRGGDARLRVHGMCVHREAGRDWHYREAPVSPDVGRKFLNTESSELRRFDVRILCQ